MANLVRYYFRKLGANFVDFKLDYPSNNLSLIGSDVVYVGSSGVDRVYVAKGVKFTFNNSGTGIDEIYLDGSFGDYSLTAIGTSTLLLTSTAKANTSITLASEDKVFFSDGSSGVKSLITYAAARIGTPSTPLPTLNTAENSLTLPSTSNLDSILRAYTKDPAGVVFAQPHAGVEFILTGHNGVDKVYVSKGGKVNANNLGTGVDLIYLTGNKNEYSPTAVGTSVLVLTKGTERVTLASEDRVIFADGSTLVKAAITAASGANWQALSLDSNTRTPGLVTDTQAPAMPTLALGAGVSDGTTAAEATAATGVVSVLAESGSTVLLTFSDSASPMHTLLKTVIGTGSALAVTLQSGDIGSGAAQLQDGSITISATATDAAGNTSTAGTASFTLDTLAPSINASSFAVNENTQAVGTATLSNADSVTWALAGNGADNALFAIDPASGAITWLAASGPDFEAATQSAAGSNSYTLSVSATDAAGNQSTQTINMRVMDVNEAPLNATPGAITGNEDIPVAIPGISVSDADASPNGIASVQLSVAHGTLSVSVSANAANGLSAAGISGNNSASLTLSGNQAAINATLASLGYLGNANFSGTDTLNIQTRDGASPALSSSNSVSISINSVNDVPTLQGIPAEASNITHAIATALADFSVNDADAANTILFVTLNPSNGVITGFANGSANGLLTTLSGSTVQLTGTAASINAALAAASFTASAAGTASIAVRVSDADLEDSNPASSSNANYRFTVASTPILSLSSGQDAYLNSSENELLLEVLFGNLSSNDTVQLKQAGNAIGSLHTVTPEEAAAHQLSLTLAKNLLGADGSKSISADITHGGDAPIASNALSLTLDTSAPAMPTLALGSGISGGATAAEATANSGAVSVTADPGSSVLVTFSDSASHSLIKTLVGSGSAQAVTLSSADLGSNPGAGNQQLQDGNITVSASATDAAGNTSPAGNSSSASFNLDSQPPLISTRSLSAHENTQAVGSAALGNTDSVTWALAGNTDDNALFAIDPVNAAIRWQAANGRDFEAATRSAAGSNSYTLTLWATDAAGNQSTQAITVHLLDVNEAPLVTIPAAAPSVNEDTPLPISGISVSDVDAGSNGIASVSLNVAHGRLSVSTNANAGNAANAGLTAEAISGNNSNSLTLSGTQAAINATLATLNYQGNPNFNGTDTLSVQSHDGGNPALSSSNSTASININPVNDAPNISGIPATTVDITRGVAAELENFSVSDLDSADTLLYVTLSPSNGVIGGFTGGSADGLETVITGNTVQLSGTAASINSALTAATFTSSSTGAASIQVRVSDASLSDTNPRSSNSASYSFNVFNTPVLTIASGQNAYINQTESDITVEVSLGSLAAGDTVQLRLGGSNLGSLHTVSDDEASANKASISIAKGDLGAEGNKIISAQVNHSGSPSNSNTLSLTLDTTAPASPTLTPGSGVADGATRAEALASSGIYTVTAEAASSVLITFTDSASNSITKTLSGSGTAQAISLSSTDIGSGGGKLQDGNISVSASATDAAGNLSPVGNSANSSFNLDTSAPLAALLNLGMGVANGATAAEATANSGVLTVEAESDSSITLTLTDSANHSLIKTLTGSGSAQAIILSHSELGSGNNQLQDGNIRISAVVRDAAGNSSTASTSFDLDTSAPAAPTLSLGPGISGTVSLAEATSAQGLITVQAEAGSSVSLTFTDSSGHSLSKQLIGNGSALAVTLLASELGNNNGNPLQDGSISVSASVTDAAGNIGNTPASSSFVLDSVAPLPQVHLAESPIAGTFGAASAQAGAVLVRSSEAGTARVLFSRTDSNNNNLVHSLTKTVTLAQADSGLAVTLSASDLASLGDGSISVTVSASDSAGNTTLPGDTASTSFVLDTTPPAAPTLARVTGKVGQDGLLGRSAASDGAFTVRAEAQSLIQLTLQGLDSNNQPVPASRVEFTLLASGGSDVIRLNLVQLATLGDRPLRISATATDRVGNTSNPSNSLSLSLDATAPAAPLISLVTDSGVSNSDNISNTNNLVVSQLAADAVRWEYRVDDGVDNAAAWLPGNSTSLTASEGLHSYTVRQFDPAGNASASFTRVVTIDTTAPETQLQINLPTDPLTGYPLAKNSSVPVTGLEAGNQLLYRVQGGTWTSLPANVSNFNASSGLRYYELAQRDTAGNVGNSYTFRILLDTTAPVLDLNTAAASANYVQSMPYALQLDGGASGSNSKYVSLPSLSISGDLTLEAWVLANSAPASTRVFYANSGSAPNDELVLGFDATGKLNFKASNGSSSLVNISSTSSFSTGQWVHIAASIDASNMARLYVNGVEQSVTGSPNLSAALSNTARSTVWLGKSGTSGEAFFNGYLRDVRVYDAVRSASTIQADLAGAINTAESSLKAAYAFNNSFASQVSGQGNATAQNSAAMVLPGQWLDNPAGRARITDDSSLQSLQIDISGLRDGASEQLSVGSGASSITITLDGSGATSGTATVGAVQWNWSLTQQNAQPHLEFSLPADAAFSPTTGQSLLQALRYSDVAASRTGSTRVFSISAKDIAGNLSSPVSSSIESAAAAAPSLKLQSDTGVSSSDGITNTAQVQVLGLAEGATWQYQVDGAGNWINGSGSSFAASSGSHFYRVHQTNASGVTSADSASFSVVYSTQTPVLDLDTASASSANALIAPVNALQLNAAAGGKVGLPGFSFGGDTSLEFWINPSASANDAVLMEFKNVYNHLQNSVAFDRITYLASSGNLRIEIFSGLPGVTTIPSIVLPLGLQANVWTHVAVTSRFYFDGAANYTPGWVYTNGILGYTTNNTEYLNIADGDGFITAITMPYLSNTLGQGAAGGNYFDGQLRDLRIYDDTRTAAEVASDLLGNIDITDSNLALALAFDGNTSGVAGARQFNYATKSLNRVTPQPAQASLSTGASLDNTLKSNLDNTFGGGRLSFSSNQNLAQVQVDVAGLQDGSQDILTVTTTGNQQAAIVLDGSATNQGSFTLAGHSWNWLLTQANGQSHVLFTAAAGGATAAQTQTLLHNLSYQNTAYAPAGGNRVFSFVVTDLAGNSNSAVSTTLDNTPPPNLGYSLVDSGLSNSDGISNSATVTLQGLEAGASWELQTDGGNWLAGSGSSFSASAGWHSYSLRQRDAAGNYSLTPTRFTLTLDSSAPATPTLQLQIDSGMNDGMANSDGISNAPAIAVSGLEANTRWEYAVDGSNNWVAGTRSSFNASPGPHSYRVRQTDLAGNTSPVSSTLSVTYLALSTPATPSLALSLDSGNSNTDNISNAPELAVSGLLPDYSVQYQVDDSGIWLLVPGNASIFDAQEGVHSYRVRQVDAAGNVSAASPALRIEIDTTLPTAPTLSLASDSGFSSTDGISAQDTLRVSGIEAGATVQYQKDGAGSLITVSNGSFLAIADGATHRYQVKQTDVAGNAGNLSTAFMVRVDNTAPMLQSAANSASINGRTLTLAYNEALASAAGYLPAASDFALSDGNSVQSVQVNSSSLLLTLATPYLQGAATPTLSYTPASLAAGQARLQDLAGNAAAALSQRTLSNASTQTLLLQVKSPGDNYLNSSETSITLSAFGNFANGSAVAVFRADNSGLPSGSALSSQTLSAAASSRDFTLSRANVGGSDGSYSLLVQYTPSGGSAQNASAISLTVDTAIADVSSNTLSLSAASDTGTQGDSLSNMAYPSVTVSTLNGKVFTVGDQIQILDSSNANQLVGSYAVLAADINPSVVGGMSGSWKNTTKDITLSSALGNGSHVLMLRVLDAAGNSSSSSAGLSLTIDTSTPATPAISLQTDTGSSNSDGITNNPTIRVQGLEAGASWQYQVDGQVDGSGTWIAGSGSTFTALEGQHSYVVRQSDAAGNSSNPSNTLQAKLHSAATLSLVVAADNQISIAEGQTGFVLGGSSSADDGQTVTLGITAQNGAGQALSSNYSATVQNGQWTVSLPSTLTQTWGSGPVSFTATVGDVAGNSGSASASLAYSSSKPVMDLDSATASSNASHSFRSALNLFRADGNYTDSQKPYAKLTSSDTLAFGAQKMTLESWINVHGLQDASQSNQALPVFINNAIRVWQESVTGKLLFHVLAGNTVLADIKTDNSFPVNQWAHLAISFDANQAIHIYFDGQEQSWTGTTVQTSGTVTASEIWLIGTSDQNTSTTTPTFKGQVSDFRVFAGVRSQNQIQSDMANPFTFEGDSPVIAASFNGNNALQYPAPYAGVPGNHKSYTATLGRGATIGTAEQGLDNPNGTLTISSDIHIQSVTLDASGLLDGANEQLKVVGVDTATLVPKTTPLVLNTATSVSLRVGLTDWTAAVAPGASGSGQARIVFTAPAGGATTSAAQALLQAIQYIDVTPSTTAQYGLFYTGYIYAVPSQGTRNFVVQLRDVAGNLSDPVNSSFDNQTTPPSAPVLNLSQDGGVYPDDHITPSGSLLVQNLAAGTSWQYAVDGNPFQDGSGSQISLQQGQHLYSVRQRDARQNFSPVSRFTATLDNEAPALTSNVQLQTLNSSGQPKTGVLLPGDVLQLQLDLGEAASNLAPLPGQISGVLRVGSTARTLKLSTAGNGLVLLYTFQDSDNGGVAFDLAALRTALTGNSVQDLAGNLLQVPALNLAEHNLVVDNQAPVLSGVGYLGSSGQSLHTTGDVLRFAASFSEDIRIDTSLGQPSLLLQVGNNNRTASYVGTLDNKRLVFSYTVQAADSAAQGVALPPNALQLGASVVKDATGNLATSIGNAAQTISALYSIDNSAPVFSSASLVGNQLTLDYGDGETLQTAYGQSASTGDFTVRFGATAVAVTAASTQGSKVVLTLAQAAPSTQTGISVSYSASSNASDSSNIADLAGNRAASLVNQAVLNNTPSDKPLLYVKTNAVPFVALEADNSFNSSETRITLQLRLGSGAALAAEATVQLYLRDTTGNDTAIGTAYPVTAADSTIDLELDRSAVSATAQAGSYQLVAQYASGNSSSYSDPLTLSIAPQTDLSTASLSLTEATDLGNSSTDLLTSNTRPVLRIGNLNGQPFAVNDLLQVIDTSNGGAVVGQYVVQAGDIYQGRLSGGYLDCAITTALSPGLHNLKVQSISATGNTSQSTSVAVTIDTGIPVLTSMTIAGDDRISIAEGRAAVTVSGSTTGVEDGQVLSLTVPGSNTVFAATVNSNAWSTTLPQTLVSVWTTGNLRFIATLQDKAGNVATPLFKTLSYSTSAPALDLDSAAASTNQWAPVDNQLYVVLGNSVTSPTISVSGNLTTEFWYFTSFGTNNANLFALGSHGLKADAAGNIQFSTNGQSLGAIAPNRWTHVAWTEDGTGSVSFYLNGVLQTTFSGVTALASGSYNLTFGGANSPHALFRDVRVYDYARTAANIKSDLLNAADLSDSNLKAAYVLDGQHWLDSSVSGQAAISLAGSAATLQNDSMPLGNANAPIRIASDTNLQQIVLSASGQRDGASESLYLDNGNTPVLRFDAAASSSGSFSREAQTWTWTRTNTGSGSTITLTAPSGGVTAVQAQNLLNALSYVDSASTPTQGDRSIGIEVLDLAGNRSAVVTATVSQKPYGPAQLQASSSNDTGVLGDNITSALSPMLLIPDLKTPVMAVGDVIRVFDTNTEETLYSRTVAAGDISASHLTSNQVSLNRSLAPGSYPLAWQWTHSGVTSTSKIMNLTIDTVSTPPTITPVLANVGVDQLSLGVLSISAEAGSTFILNFSKAASSFSKTVVASGSASSVNVALSASDISALGNSGTVSVSATSTDPAGNVSTPVTSSFNLVNAANPPSIVFSTAVSANAASASEAVSGAGFMTVSSISAGTITVQFSRAGNSVSKTISSLGGGTAVGVVLAATDLSTLGDGAVAVSATLVPSSAALAQSAASSASFNLDATAPSPATLSTAVSAGTAVNRAVALNGAVNVVAEAGSSVIVTFASSAGGSVTNTVTGNGSTPVKVALLESQLGSSGSLLRDGTITVTSSVTDVAGNTSSNSSTSFVLDSTPPSPPVFRQAGALLVPSTKLAPVDLLLSSSAITIQAPVLSRVEVELIETVNGVSHSIHKTIVGTGSAMALPLTAEDLIALGGSGLVTLNTTSTDAAGNVKSDTQVASFTLNANPPLVRLGVANGQDNIFSSSETTLDVQVGYLNLWPGDTLQLTLDNQPLAHTLHTVTEAEANAGFSTLSLQKSDFAGSGSHQIKAQISSVFGGSGTSAALALNLQGGILQYGSGSDAWLNASETSETLRFVGDAETMKTGRLLQLQLAGVPLGTPHTVTDDDVTNGYADLTLPRYALGNDGSKVLSVGYVLQGVLQNSNTLNLSVDTQTPSFASLPQQHIITHGIASPLLPLLISDTNASEILDLTLQPSPGTTLSGLTDTDTTQPDIQLHGTAAQLSTLLSNALFTAPNPGTANLALILADTAQNQTVQTYEFGVL